MSRDKGRIATGRGLTAGLLLVAAAAAFAAAHPPQTPVATAHAKPAPGEDILDPDGPAGNPAWQSWGRASGPCGEGRPCTWERTVGGASDDKISAVATLPNGGFVIAGNSRENSGSFYDAWTLGVGKDGRLLWRQAFGGAQTDQIQDLAVTTDGEIFAVGHTRSQGAGESDLWLLRLADDGTVRERRTLGGEHNDRARAAAPDAGGGVFVTGFTASEGAGGRDIWIMRFSPDGTPLWTRTIGGAGYDDGYDIIAMPDGGAAVTGFVWTDDSRGFDLAVIRLSAAGETVWRRSFHRAAFEAGTALDVTPDGGLVVLGTTSTDGLRDQDIWAIRLNADGEMLWQQTYGGPKPEEPWGLAASASGGFLVAAQTFSKGAGGDIWLFRLTPDGAIAWERTHGGPKWDHPSALLEMPEGGMLIAGHTASKGAGFKDGWLLRLDTEGRF